MLDFLKKLFSSKNRKLTFVVFDNEEPESSTSYKFAPSRLLILLYWAVAGIILFVLLLVMFTPLGNLVYHQEDKELRNSVIKIQQEVASLRDSLETRDMQLSEIQQVLATDKDTIFDVTSNLKIPDVEDGRTVSSELQPFSEVNSDKKLSQNEIIFSGLLQDAPEFPASYPVEGTLTRGYNTEIGHYGIDIATPENTPFRAIADGAIVSQDWTVNYGYVLHIQHSNGILTLYKHASSVAKSVGDIVLKGDVLGTIGDTGVLSSGPHLHLEIWKNGVPHNPDTYLIKP